MHCGTAMNFLRRSSIYACLPVCAGMQESSMLHLCRIACGSYKYSSWLRFKSWGSPTFLSSSFQKSRIPGIRLRCTATESPHFHDMISSCKKQAKHSVLIELSSKKDIPCVLNLCKQYGDVKNMIAFIGTQSKFQVIAEFVHVESVQNILSDSSLRDVTEVFPYHSHCLRFENKGKQGHPAKTSGEVIDLSLETKSLGSRALPSVSEMMIELYEKEKMSDLSIRLRFLSCVMLEDALKGMFPYCTTLPFGSSVNGFGKASSDLDLMLRLFPEQVNKNSELFFQTKYVGGNSRDLQRRTVYALGDIFQTFIPGITHVRRVLNARVPILKYQHQQLLDLECDISVNNMSAVYMSEILFFCGELDPRVRPLVYTVKKWAKEANVTYGTPGSWITNFSLTLLVVFFLQSRPVPILPPLSKLIKLPSFDAYETCAVEYVTQEGSSSLKPAMKGQNSESLSVLLQEFFSFLAGFPFKEKRISVIAGVANSIQTEHAMWIDYPLDESCNVSKNISFLELQHLCRSAFAAGKNMEKSSNSGATDLMSVLGVLGLKQDNPNRIDIRAFLDEPSRQNKFVTSVT